MKTFRFLSIMIFFSIGLFISCAGGSDSQTKPIPSAPNKVTYTVTYNGNGNISGTVPSDTALYETGQIVTVPGNTGSLAKTGFAFTGWNTLADGSGTTFTQGQTFAMGAVDVILYAKWTANPTYTVSYNGNGNTGGSIPIDSTNYEQGQNAAVPENTGNLSNIGYTFSGWNTLTDGSGTTYTQGQTFAMGSANIILYAKWTANPTYTLTYDGNGDTSGSAPVDSTNYEQAQNITVLENTGNLSKIGYTFSGWNTLTDGNGTNYTQGQTFAMGGTNITLFAKWTAVFTITYNGNGSDSGSTPVDSTNYEQTQNIAVLGNAGNLSKNGYSFSGWNTLANGTGTTYAGGQSFAMGSANVTLFAIWKAVYQVFYDGNTNDSGAAPEDNNSYQAGHIVTVPGNPAGLAKTGSAFNGWNTLANGSGTTYRQGATHTMGSSDMTLYALWTTNQTYTVTYDGNSNNSGTVPVDTTLYEYDQEVILEGNTGSLIKSGYSFIGWNTQTDGNGDFYIPGSDTYQISGADITLYAMWTTNPTYKVIYNDNGSNGGTFPVDANSYEDSQSAMVIGNTGNLVKFGYHFIGWNTQADGSGTYYPQGMNTQIAGSDQTLFAYWAENPLKVIYDGNGHDAYTVPNDPYYYVTGEEITVLAGTVSKTGYRFLGWNTLIDGNGSNYIAGDKFTIGSSSVTLYANWAPLYNVLYDGNGAINVPSDSLEYVAGESVIIRSLGSMVYPGYALLQWNTESNGSGTAYTEGQTIAMGSGTIDLYAIWTGDNMDPTFSYVGNGLNNTVNTHTIDSDGKIIVGGYFTSYNGITRNRIARLDADGSLDTSFDPGTGASSTVFAMKILTDGKILIGGNFTTFNGLSRARIARLEANGTLDTSFDPGTGANSSVFGIAVQNDGKILIAGNFTLYNGTAINRIARLNPGGTLDTTFNSGFSGTNDYISDIKLQADGKILIGGHFTAYAGTPRNRIARLNSDGSLDPAFDPGQGIDATESITNIYIKNIALQSDGKIIISGDFNLYDGISRSRIARLNSDGSLDTSFNPGTGASYFIHALALQADGKIIIGGGFDTFNGLTRHKLARLNPDGSLDNSFYMGAGTGQFSGEYVNDIAIQSDDKIVISGKFYSYNGVSRRMVARVNP